MPDVVRDLVVSLSLDAGEFARNMRAINASIKEAESTFKLAGAGVDRFGSGLGGQMAKAETLMRTQTLQSAAVRQYAAHLGEANAKMSATQGYLATYSARLEEARGRLTSMNAAIESQNARVLSAQAVFSREDAALQSHLSSINTVTQGITRLEQEIAACEMQYEHNLNTLGAADDETERYRVRLDALNASLTREKNTLASLQSNTKALT